MLLEVETPEPFVPPGTDVSALNGFMLNVERLLASELIAIGSPEECWAALMLWCRAWKQIPAGSLPNDARVLASFSGAGKRWSKVREVALRGFTLCSDGRLYHRFLCIEVLKASSKQAAFRKKREQDRERLTQWRHRRDETHDETHDETRFVAEGTGTGTGTGTGKKERKDSTPPGSNEPFGVEVASPPKRGSRLPADLDEIPPDWLEAAIVARQKVGLPDVSLMLDWEKFKNHWPSQPGQRGRKTDWKKTWVNWALNATPPWSRNGAGTPAANLFEGAWRVANEADERERPKQSGDNGTDRGSAYPLLDRR